MKRPSGFDGGGESREPDDAIREEDRADDRALVRDSDAASGDSAVQGGVVGAPGEGKADSLLGRRLAALGLSGQGPGGESAAPGAGERATEPGAGHDHAQLSARGGELSAGPHEAETVDLSEVREARATEETEHGGFFTAGEDLRAPGRGNAAENAGDAVVVSTQRSRLGLLARTRAEREADPVRAAERRLKEAGRARRARFKRERKRFSADSRRRRRNWLIAGGAVAALAAFVAVGVFTPLMAVREVRVEGASAVDSGQVQTALAGFVGTPLALVEDSAVHKALEAFPMIQRYAVERIPPSTLVVRLEERVPVLAVKQGEGFTLYDAAGVVLAQSPEAPGGVPTAEGALSNTGSVAFGTTAGVLRDMPAELRAQMAGVSASSGQDVTFRMASGVEVIWGDGEETRYKALVLQTTLASLAAQEIPVSRIDVSSPGAPVFQ